MKKKTVKAVFFYYMNQTDSGYENDTYDTKEDMMRDVDWEILYELYKNPNMTKVANKLYVSQPSLSKRIQYIESEFQVQIFERTSKGLVFTEAGALLGQRAEEHLSFVNETKRLIDHIKSTEVHKLIIGSSYTYSKFKLSDILIHYKDLHPKASFEILNAQSNELFKKVVDGEIDFAFVRGDYEGNVIKKQIGENQAYIVTKAETTLDKLPRENRIYYQTNDRTTELLDDWWRDKFHTDPSEGMHIGFIDFAWQIIDKGLGYTICFLPDNFDNRFNLTLTPIAYSDGNPVMRRTWFVYRNEKLNVEQKNFIRYVEDICEAGQAC